jgi:hypothetical protein
MREQVGRPPEEFHAGGPLEALGVGDNLVEVAVRFGERAALGGDVAIVEAVKRCADFLEKLKGGIQADLRDRDRVGALFPRPDNRARAERIGAGAAEGVPVGDGEAQVRTHRPAVDHLVGVVVAKGERVGRLRPFIGDGLDAGKVSAGFFHGRRLDVPRV